MTRVEFLAVMYSLESVHEEAGGEAALKVIKKIIKEIESEKKEK